MLSLAIHLVYIYIFLRDVYTHFRSRLNWAFATLSPLRVRFQSKPFKSKSGAPKMTSERKGQNDVRGANEKKIIVYVVMLNNGGKGARVRR